MAYFEQPLGKHCVVIQAQEHFGKLSLEAVVPREAKKSFLCVLFFSPLLPAFGFLSDFFLPPTVVAGKRSCPTTTTVNKLSAPLVAKKKKASPPMCHVCLLVCSFFFCLPRTVVEGRGRGRGRKLWYQLKKKNKNVSCMCRLVCGCVGVWLCGEDL